MNRSATPATTSPKLWRTATAAFVVILASAGHVARAESLWESIGLLGRPQILPGAPDGDSPFAGNPNLPRDRPHPAVARIIVPEGDATSYGSGTLVDVRDKYGLVVTNWHVVRDGHGEVEVVFPDGFRSQARPLKVDADWDLAALVVWRPPAAPVKIAAKAPQPGDQLTICGYGSGQYRAATGRCTQYYAPTLNLPQHMVELNVEARQGDSGGPIFNAQGELAGVLFGAGRGTTLGSFGGRVESFLASLAPGIGTGTGGLPSPGDVEPPAIAQDAVSPATVPGAPIGAPSASLARHEFEAAAMATLKSPSTAAKSPQSDAAVVALANANPSSKIVADGAWHAVAARSEERMPPTNADLSRRVSWPGHAKNGLAVIGAIALMLQLARLVR